MQVEMVNQSKGETKKKKHNNNYKNKEVRKQAIYIINKKKKQYDEISWSNSSSLFGIFLQ